MTEDQKINYRMGFQECLSIMFDAFSNCAHYPQDEVFIVLFVEAKDKAAALLSEIVE